MRRWTFPLLAAATLAACARQPAVYAPDAPGFWWGILHGLISPVSLLAGIVSDVRIYAFPNSGLVYDLGFMLGAGPAFFMSVLFLLIAVGSASD